MGFDFSAIVLRSALVSWRAVEALGAALGANAEAAARRVEKRASFIISAEEREGERG